MSRQGSLDRVQCWALLPKCPLILYLFSGGGATEMDSISSKEELLCENRLLCCAFWFSGQCIFWRVKTGRLTLAKKPNFNLLLLCKALLGRWEVAERAWPQWQEGIRPLLSLTVSKGPMGWQPGRTLSLFPPHHTVMAALAHIASGSQACALLQQVRVEPSSVCIGCFQTLRCWIRFLRLSDQQHYKT